MAENVQGHHRKCVPSVRIIPSVSLSVHSVFLLVTVQYNTQSWHFDELTQLQAFESKIFV